MDWCRRKERRMPYVGERRKVKMGKRMSDSNIFNSTFETELRVLILLSAARKKAYSVERIVDLDFITCYASHFQLPYINLQGDNAYMYTELPGRRERIREAIRHLVTQGLLNVQIENGYLFSISDVGNKFVRKLKSEYAIQYKAIATDAISMFKDTSDLALDRMLNDNAVKVSIRGGR